MAKKSLPNTTFAKVVFVFMVVFAAVSIYSLQGKGVLGLTTSPTPTPAPSSNSSACKPPRVTVLKLSTACDSTSRDGFRTATYQCSNGKTGDASQGCMNVSEALSYAKAACAKNYKCPITPTPTFRPESPTPSHRPPSPTVTPHAPTPTPH